MREKKFTTNKKNHILHCGHCKKSHVLPHEKKFVPYEHECPLCNFQVIETLGSVTVFHMDVRAVSVCGELPNDFDLET